MHHVRPIQSEQGRRDESRVVEGDVPVESSWEPERVIRNSELMDVPAVLELSLLSVGFDVVPAGLVQGFLFCVQKPEPFLQPEKFEDNVREIEPAGGLQQPLGV